MSGKEKRRRQRNAAGQPALHGIHSEVSALARLEVGDLRKAWASRFDTPPPAIRSRDLLLRMLAWKVQEKVFGGLDADTRRTLANVATALERDGSYEPKIRQGISAGVVLVREWKGVTHKVTVIASGFQHLGKRYKSLSDIARTITGTRWSGPRFFGLEQKPARRRTAP